MSIHVEKKKSGTLRYKAIIQMSKGRQRSKRFLRKADAQEWESEQKYLLKAQSSYEPVNDDLTVSDLARIWTEEYARNRKAESSLRRDDQLFRNQIIPALGMTKVTVLKPERIEQWLNELVSGGLSKKSCNHVLGLLKTVLKYSVERNLCAKNPAATVKAFKLDEQDFSYLTKAELKTLLNFIKEEYPSYYPLYAFAFHTGLRKGEIRGLRWDCVHLEQGFITVKRSFCEVSDMVLDRTKGKTIRRVPINSECRAVLESLIDGGEFVFSSYDYAHLHRTTRSLCRKAGVRELRFHDTRHTFASVFMMEGGKIYDLQKILGHSTIAMTERYSHLAPDHLRDATKVLEGICDPVIVE